MRLAMRRIGPLAVLGLALGACSSVDFTSLRPVDFSTFSPRSTAALSDTIARPATQQDMVDDQGRCMGGGPAATDGAAPGGADAAGSQTLGLGVALNMTECEVVHRLGAPERVSFGQNERNERTATLTYTRGNWPGLYQFTAGRLTVMESVPTAPRAGRRR